METVVAIPIGWTSIVALFVPALVAFITKYRGSNAVAQALAAIAASGVLAVVQALTDDVPNDTVQALLATFLGVALPMLFAYLGFWQPVAKANQRFAPDKGI